MSTTGVSCQGFAVPDLASIVRLRPLVSTAVGGDCHLLAHSVARGGLVLPRVVGGMLSCGDQGQA